MEQHVRVLLVEDDPDLAETTRLVLERHGMVVDTAADGIEALERTKATRPDVAVVDVVLPRLDGLALTERLVAADPPIPVVLLTARDLPSDELHGLERGAVDYVRKPFDGPILAARVRIAAGRVPKEAGAADGIGRLRIDRRAMEVFVDGVAVELTTTEFRLLVALADHVGAVLSREQLLTHAWGDPGWSAERIVDVNVQRLRAKLGTDQIQTVRGAGYKLVR